MNLTFTLPSNPHCPPLVCGEGHDVFVRLKNEFKSKSKDGTGYLRGRIEQITQLTAVSWSYRVLIDEEAEVYPGETVTAVHVMESLCCLSCADAGILAKLGTGGGGGDAPTATGLTWQTVVLFGSESGVRAGTEYLFRRFSAFRLHSIEAAIHSGSGPVDIQLQVSGADNHVYSSLGGSMTIAAPHLTSRYDPANPLTVNAKCALRAAITHGGIYPVAYGLELHLLTSEIS